MLLTTILLSLLCAEPHSQDTLSVMFWNLENFFDFTDGGTSESDKEFSSEGAKRWTRGRFYTKASIVAKTILWAEVPDAVGVAEVENAGVLKAIVRSPALKQYDYGLVHYDSPDPRGIDVGLLYNKRRLKLLSSKPHRVNGGTTRDILEAIFETPRGDTLALLVNHHPSKYGGASSASKREGAMLCLANICDSLPYPVVALGDFNDTPNAETFGLLEGRLINLALPISQKGEGSLRFEGKWELIDMFLISQDLSAQMSVLYPPFLLTKDAAHSGVKPLRTYSGPRYLGGVSDHLPVLLRIFSKFADPL